MFAIDMPASSSSVVGSTEAVLQQDYILTGFQVSGRIPERWLTTLVTKIKLVFVACLFHWLIAPKRERRSNHSKKPSVPG